MNPITWIKNLFKTAINPEIESYSRAVGIPRELALEQLREVDPEIESSTREPLLRVVTPEELRERGIIELKSLRTFHIETSEMIQREVVQLMLARVNLPHDEADELCIVEFKNLRNFHIREAERIKQDLIGLMLTRVNLPTEKEPRSHDATGLEPNTSGHPEV